MAFAACQKETGKNPEPVITYLDYEKFENDQGKDSLVVIRFSFEDGDGDLGYTDADTLPPFQIGDPYFYNLHTDFYEMQGGNPVHYIDMFSGDTIHYSQRIPTLTPDGKYKGISGTIELRVDFTLLQLNGYTPANFQMDFWVNDRALHHSNNISTPQINLNL